MIDTCFTIGGRAVVHSHFANSKCGFIIMRSRSDRQTIAALGQLAPMINCTVCKAPFLKAVIQQKVIGYRFYSDGAVVDVFIVTGNQIKMIIGKIVTIISGNFAFVIKNMCDFITRRRSIIIMIVEYRGAVYTIFVADALHGNFSIVAAIFRQIGRLITVIGVFHLFQAASVIRTKRNRCRLSRCIIGDARRSAIRISDFTQSCSGILIKNFYGIIRIINLTDRRFN